MPYSEAQTVNVGFLKESLKEFGKSGIIAMPDIVSGIPIVSALATGVSGSKSSAVFAMNVPHNRVQSPIIVSVMDGHGIIGGITISNEMTEAFPSGDTSGEWSLYSFVVELSCAYNELPQILKCTVAFVDNPKTNYSFVFIGNPNKPTVVPRIFIEDGELKVEYPDNCVFPDGSTPA